MIRAVIFDMDGTLADTDPFIKKAIINRFQELHLPMSDTTSSKRTLVDFWAEIKKKHKLSDSVDSLVQQTREIYWTMLEGINSLPGVLETLKKLKKNNIKIGLASGASQKSIQIILGELKITKYFEAIVSTHDVGKHKPDPEVYLEAARRLGVAPSECLAIEDETIGIAAARAAGMKCVGVKLCATEELRADIILESLDAFEVELL